MLRLLASPPTIKVLPSGNNFTDLFNENDNISLRRHFILYFYFSLFLAQIGYSVEVSIATWIVTTNFLCKPLTFPKDIK